MRFNDDVVILRPLGADEYGNPSASWATPVEIPAKAFVRTEKAYFPKDTDIAIGDRLSYGGEVYEMEPRQVRSPSRAIMWTATLRPVGRE